MKRQHILYLIPLAIAIALSSCVSKKYQIDKLSVANNYRDINTTDTNSLAKIPSAQLFNDPQLQQLIKQGIANNLDLKAAIARMKSAEANLRLSKSAYLPSLNLDASVTSTQQSRSAQVFAGAALRNETYKLQLSSTWEIDVWGKLGSAKRVALATLLQSDAAKRAVQTQLVANIANYYYQLLALDQQLRITEQTLQKRIESVATIKAMKEAGIVNGAAVVQAEANRYATEVSIPDLKKSIRETENALQTLLGNDAGLISRGLLSQQQVYQQLNTGLPSQLLKNRPDVQQAELAFRVAFENTNLARSNFYPQLTLTGNAGHSTLNIKNLFNNSVFYNIVAGLSQPIFNKGLNKAKLASAKALQEEAFYNFQRTLLSASAEVSNALFSYQTASNKEEARNKQIASLEKAVDYTKELLKYNSATNYTDVLTSEQSLLNAQLSAVNDQLQKLQSVVNLYRALGGGWQE